MAAPEGRTVLVTGASSGIGRATALAAARAGFVTVGTVRDPADAASLRAAADGVRLDVRRLDVTDPDSVANCVAGVVRTHGRLDALVNNAGIANAGHTLERNDMAVIRANMEVNFFGVVSMSRAALPHLRFARGRLVTISSVRGVIGQPFNEAYSAAKFAVEGFMEGLAPVAAEVGVTVSVIEPAAVLDSAFVANARIDPAELLATAGPYATAFRAYRDYVRSGAVAGAQTSAEVAEVVLRVLTEERPAFRIQTSAWAREYVSRKLADPDGAAVQALTRSWVRAD
ncbi:SDR family NAD(P)-dependent oxidoreductase [Plantactinospora sp. GCM10030261]|uniref:SDR family NAD(P)-dependent oxidoreductase n=1 Tax=Plantactinospora sp. GCM10030261 TaxID=3273420 RepID=UPI0036173CF3